MASNDFKLEQTAYGFIWGPMDLERTCSDPKFGITLTLKSDHREVEVRMSPKGRRATVHVRDADGWKRVSG